MQTPLSILLSYAAKITALSALAFAAFKLVMIAEQLGGLAALAFSGLHLPLCLFSSLIVWWFFDTNQSIGFLALLSTLLNALLI